MRYCKKCSRGSSVASRRVDEFCWSCIGGGFGKDSNKRRYDAKFRNCCRTCWRARTCEVCDNFNDDVNLAWCCRCSARLARWCTTCNEEDSLKPLRCSCCMEQTSASRTSELLSRRHCSLRNGEVLRFGLDEWSGTAHRVTHFLDAGQRHVITASSDAVVRVWNVRNGLLQAFLRLPRIGCRIDALCFCGETAVVIVATQHIEKQTGDAKNGEYDEKQGWPGSQH